jgi:hypothetical protein
MFTEIQGKAGTSSQSQGTAESPISISSGDDEPEGSAKQPIPVRDNTSEESSGGGSSIMNVTTTDRRFRETVGHMADLLNFGPKLLTVLKSSKPPSVDFFRVLPVHSGDDLAIWLVLARLPQNR